MHLFEKYVPRMGKGESLFHKRRLHIFTAAEANVRHLSHIHDDLRLYGQGDAADHDIAIGLQRLRGHP